MEDTNIFRGAVVSINGTGAAPEGRAQHAAVLDSQDLNWRKNEISQKCVVLVDNCFVMSFSDPGDHSPVAQTATEKWWFQHATPLNVEARFMSRTGSGGAKWIQEDRRFQNKNSVHDPVLADGNCNTWASHLTSPVGKTLVITGRNEDRKFTLEELLNRLDSFIASTMSRRRALISLVVIVVSFEEIMAMCHKSDTSRTWMRLPDNLKPDFILTLVGILQQIQRLQGGKAIVIFPDHHSNQPDWHPDDAKRIDEFCDMCVGVVRVHGIYATKALGFSHQLERASKGRVFFTVNNLKMRADWIKGYATAMDMLPQPIWCDLYAEWLADFFHKWTQKSSQVMPGSVHPFGNSPPNLREHCSWRFSSWRTTPMQDTGRVTHFIIWLTAIHSRQQLIKGKMICDFAFGQCLVWRSFATTLLIWVVMLALEGTDCYRSS